MLTPLQHLATVFTDYEVDRDLDCVLAACTSAPERIVAKAYRIARKRAPGWAPGQKGASNRATVPPEWSDPQRVADQLRVEMQCSPDTEPDVLLRRVLTQLGRSNGAPMATCDRCGHEFTAKRSDARLCSPRCRQAETRGRRSAVSQISP